MRIFKIILVTICFLITKGFCAEHRKKCNSCHSSFLKGKIPKDNLRYKTFLKVLKLLDERGARVIVETGTDRNGIEGCKSDGCSTLIFAEWSRSRKAEFFSIDIDEKALRQAAKFLGEARKFVHFVCIDSVAFLENFNRPIDFLYLDSFDFDENNPRPSQEHHLKEIKAAYPRLTKNSIVMIDDCALPHGGKGKLAIEFLLEKGWKILLLKHQTILVNN
jgi:hypothetical protein